MKKWNVLAKFKENGGIVETLLKNRGIKDTKTFLNAPRAEKISKDFSEGFQKSLKEIKKVVKSHIKKDLPIVIHGDYDADGICATAILHRALKKELNHDKTFSFIPNRFDHGYGLTVSSLDTVVGKLKDKGLEPGLLITVDSGITSIEAVDHAIKLGFIVVITDHHQKPKELPLADYILWEDQLVGAGIAWALANTLGAEDERLLGLAAVGTVADLQPLLGFNRSIVRDGLEILNKDSYIGLKKLREVAGRNKGKIEAYDLGWVFGPRINAAGRLGDPTEALSLLITDKGDVATGLAIKLNSLNQERQDKTVDMQNLALNFDEDDLPRVLISSHEDYHEGIIGLVAAGMAQKYYRPSIVISIDGDCGKGSVRSVSGVNIIELLRELEDLFINVGGHPMAAGFTIDLDKIGVLEEKLGALAEEKITDEHLLPVLHIDLEIPLSLVDQDLVDELKKMEPFGMGNYSPAFVSRGVTIANMNVVGRNAEHLSLNFVYEDKTYKAIFFKAAKYADEFNVGDEVDIAYSVAENEFNGRVTIDLRIKDMKSS